MTTRAPRTLLRRLCCWPPLRLWCNLANRIGGEVRRHGLGGFAARLPYYLRHSRTYLRHVLIAPPAGEARLFDAHPAVCRDFRLHPDLSSAREPIDASVSIVIPTLNAGHEFRWLLRKLQAQQGLRHIDIVIVDSGSRDETVSLARAAGCTTIEIDPSEFSHSYARNRGADAASGDYLLFMVQDAYPIGDYWIYGMMRYLLDHAADNLAAASCAEYSRSDSDVMYDSIIHNHYKFLGCLEHDRIGEFRGNDHTLLRSYGQLSDVACLIRHALFQRYHYRGDYAEDLDLGIRLIKDGYRVAMLASVKVIHSHNRLAYYYLKRSFVDTVYLVGLFDDYVYPRVESATGLIAGIVSTAGYLSDWLQNYGQAESAQPPHRKLAEWIREWRRSFAEVRRDTPARLGDDRLDAFIDGLPARFLSAGGDMDSAARREARSFLDAFLARLEHFNSFLSSVYQEQDALVGNAARDAICKTFAATAGSLLGFMYMDLSRTSGAARDMSQALKNDLQAGI